VGHNSTPEGSVRQNFLAEAQAEAVVREPGDMRATLRHARIPAEHADAFFDRLVALADEFTRLPRSGDTVFGMVAAVYRTEHPMLPEPS
jgi:hypothetical protein